MTFQEGWIQYSIMEGLQNELSLTYLPRGQLISMRKCLAEQILGNWLEIFSTYYDIYSLDVEVSREAELNEQKFFCTTLLKVQKEGDRMN